MTYTTWILLAVFVLLQVADCYLTYQGLRLGLKEENPLARWLFKRIGKMATFIVVKAVVIAIVIGAAVWFSYAALGIAGMATLVSVYIVGRNYQLIHDITE